MGSDLSVESWVPAPWNRCAAPRTSTVRRQTVAGDEIPKAFHKEFLAIGATSVLEAAYSAGEITGIDVTQPGVSGVN